MQKTNGPGKARETWIHRPTSNPGEKHKNGEYGTYWIYKNQKKYKKILLNPFSLAK